VSITAPPNNATVFGSSVTVSTSTSDNVGVVGVQFLLDGANLSVEDTTLPYSVTWNTTTATDGAHTLTGVARDAAGNTTTSSSVSVTVDNVTPASLTVRTLPGTRIFLGGNYGYLGAFQGTVPQTGDLQITSLPPGRHILRASMAGFMDAYRIVQLLPGPNVLTLNLVLFDPLATLNPTFKILDAGGPILGGGGASVPFVVDWDNDDNKDLLLAGGDGSIVLYQNAGSDAAPQFSGSTPIMADGTAIAVPGPSFVFVVDWDGDQNKDLVVGDGQGRVRWYRNTLADATPQLTEQGFLDAGLILLTVTPPAAPVVIDWNQDGLKDLLVGAGDGTMQVFLNDPASGGTDANPVLAAPVQVSLPGVILTNARPFVGDWNQDARKDLLVGYENGEVYLFLNSGTDAAPLFTTGSPLTGQGTPVMVSSQAAPFVMDWNNDGLRDLVIGSNAGEVFLAQGADLAAPAGPAGDAGSGDDGAGDLKCFIATAAYGSPLAPQVQALREFRDLYLLPHPAGKAFVALYYKLSPPLAQLIAGSDILRTIVRGGLVPIIGWAALVLWSPGLGLGVLLGVLGLGAWLALRVARRCEWVSAGRAVPLTGKRTRSRRSAPWRRLALGGCVLFILASAALLEASQKERSDVGTRVEFVGEVRLPQATRFALIRDQEAGHVKLYKRDEPIHAGENPLPVGKIASSPRAPRTQRMTRCSFAGSTPPW
jgi:hypothetical protein